MNKIPPTLRSVSSYLSPALQRPKINPITPTKEEIPASTISKRAINIDPTLAEETVPPERLKINASNATKARANNPSPAKSPRTSAPGVENPLSTLESVLNPDLTNMIENSPIANPTIPTTTDVTANALMLEPEDIDKTEVTPKPKAIGTIRPIAIPMIPRRANILIFPIAKLSAFVKFTITAVGGGPPQVGGGEVLLGLPLGDEGLPAEEVVNEDPQLGQCMAPWFTEAPHLGQNGIMDSFTTLAHDSRAYKKLAENMNESREKQRKDSIRTYLDNLSHNHAAVSSHLPERVVHDFPEISVGISKISAISTPRGLLGSFDRLCS